VGEDKMQDFIETKPEEFSFYNYPKPYKEADYANAIRDVKRKLSSIKGLRAIYTWGEVANPGISDIDFLVVLGKNRKPFPLRLRSILFLNKKLRDIIFHPFIVIDEEGMRNVSYIYPESDFRPVGKEKVTITKLPPSVKKYANIYLLSDIIVRHYPRDLMRVFLSKKIDVRNTILRLSSLVHAIRLLSRLNIKARYSNEYTASLLSLRSEWFGLGKKERDEKLLELAKKALLLFMAIIKGFDAYLQSIVSVGSATEINYTGSKNRTIFVRDWSEEASLRATREIYKKSRQCCSILPMTLAANLLEYSKGKGPLSAYIAAHLSPRTANCHIKKPEILQKRIQILNSQASLAIETKHLHFPAFFDFGFKPKSGIFGRFAHLGSRLKG
jgi:hypothetical protein